MSKSLHEVCTESSPARTAAHHPDAVVKSGEEAKDKWPHYVCPHCGLDTPLPEWNTTTAKKLLGQP